MNNATLDKLRRCFPSMVVYKDLCKNSVFLTLGLPSFMRDWLLQKFENSSDGTFSNEKLESFVKNYIPKAGDWKGIKDRIVTDYEHVKMLAKVSVDININTGEVSFSLPDFALSTKDTIIESDVWEQCKEELISGQDVWGMIELGYRLPNDTAKPKTPGKIKLLRFQNFCPYSIDLDYFKDARKDFSIQEWIDIVLGAIDYNADGYAVAKAADPERLPDIENMKMTMLSRILPFLEKRLNLIELAPQGTGKSYLFGQVSRFGWLSSSDIMTRAKFFYDISKNKTGLVDKNDFIVLDEIQKTVFEDGMGVPMQCYLESGFFNIGNYSGSGSSGLILCGNISETLMRSDGYEYLFERLPKMFHDSAIIDRFHGFIKGWNIPRMNNNLKISGWALNSEYFTSIMHELRDDISYRNIVDDLIEVPDGSDTRDTEAVKRISTAYLKLLFPHVRKPEDISTTDFNRYCLRPATGMRYTIRHQMGLMDEQHRGKGLPLYTIRKVNNNGKTM